MTTQFPRPATALLALILLALPGLAAATDEGQATVDEVIAKVNEAATFLHDRGQA